MCVVQANQPGFDSRVDLKKTNIRILERPLRFYVQAKIQKPGNNKSAEGVGVGVWDEILAKMVVHNLLDHVELSASVAAADASLPEVFMVLYNWGETGEEMVRDVDRGNVAMQALKKVATLSKEQLKVVIDVKGSTVEDISDLVQRYLSQHWGNVQMVGREGLQPWLLPTLLPFPVLLTGIGIGLDPDAEVLG